MPLEVAPQIADTVNVIVRSGRYPDENAVLSEALELLQQRDRLRASLQEAAAELDRGQGIGAREAYRQLREKAAAIAGRVS